MAKHQLNTSQPFDWLQKIQKMRGQSDADIIARVLQFYANKPSDLLQKGINIADIVLTLELDTNTIAAVILYPAIQNDPTILDEANEFFGNAIAKLLSDILRIQRLNQLQSMHVRGQQQIENIRKLILAMVSDIRAIIIMLAERIWLLHQAKPLAREDQFRLAEETAAIYAPLANRLGLWQFKWEIEDLCLRYLEPEIYKKIASWLVSRRKEREEYVQRVHELLSNTLSKFGIKHFEITGRVKHIYSIYRKMQRKQADFHDIYDISALRVLVPSIDDCYRVLSIITDAWKQIPQEFDDYISNPKPNGYQSIHIVVNGPEDKIIEIQIRTQQMHEESELGVAAHWRYKEGARQTAGYDEKIALLRQLMAWQQEIAANDQTKAEPSTKDLFTDRIYVFTPLGDVIDLPQGATPLDFAYTIHSEVGHRCRGAKVNKAIVPLTYQLQTGDKVEILTAKEPHPSRDWLVTSFGYLKTTRARAKVQHWFRMMDLQTALPPSREEKEIKASKAITYDKNKPEKAPTSIQILGINNLLTHLAYCCQPTPEDKIIGYITRARGITIHKENCHNIKRLADDQYHRLIKVNWENK